MACSHFCQIRQENTEKMDLCLLKTFVTVAKRKSISKASSEVYLTQPAVTKQIQALEKMYGKSLFERTRKELTLTEDGKLLVDYANRMLSLMEESFAMLERRGREISGRLKIASNLTLGVYIIPKILKFFRDVYPQIAIEVLLDNSENIISAIKKHDAHFGFIGVSLNEPTITLHDFYEDKLVVVLGKECGFKGNVISWKKLLDIPFIGRERGSDIRATYEAWFAERGIKIAPAIELNNTEAIKISVQNNLGFSLLPWCTVEHEVQQGFLQMVSVPYFKPLQKFYICHYKDRTFSSVERVFLASIFNRLHLGTPSLPESIDRLFPQE
jgi:LysR family transcriptional regulator, transcriptional activator of the cysJI operon